MGRRLERDWIAARRRRRTDQLEVCDAGLHFLADRAAVSVAVVVGLGDDKDARKGNGRQHECGAKSGQDAPGVRVWTKSSSERGKHCRILYHKPLAALLQLYGETVIML